MTKNVAATSYSMTATGTGGTFNSWEPTGAGGYFLLRRSMHWADDGDSTISVTVDRIVEPYLAAAGTAEVGITISDYANPTASRLTTPSSLTWSAGETGPKVATINISASAYAGPEVYAIELTSPSGATIRDYAVSYPSEGTEKREVDYKGYIFIQSDTVATGATYADASITDYTTPTGTSGDPKTALTAIYEATAGDIIYLRGGTYAETGNPSSRGIGGETSGTGSLRMKNSGTSSSPIVVLPYPNEAVIIDNNGVGRNTANENVGGFYGSGVSYWLIHGGSGGTNGSLAITDVGQHGVYVKTSGTGNVFSKLYCHTIEGAAGQNPAGIRIDDQNYCVVADNLVHNITEGGSLHLTDGHDNNACIHGYRSYDVSVENNTLHTCNLGVHHKSAPQDDHAGYIIRGNKIYNTHDAIFHAQNDNLGIGRSDYRHLYSYIYENLCYDGYRGGIGHTGFYEGAKSGWFWIWNNTVHNDDTTASVRDFGNLCLHGTKQPLVWNNLFRNDNADNSAANNNSPTIRMQGNDSYDESTNFNTKLLYLDYNGYIDGVKIVAEYSKGTRETTLVGVQDMVNIAGIVSLDSGLVDTETNGLESTSALTFTDVATDDYTLVSGTSPALAAGLNGEDMGAYADAYSTIGQR